MADEDVAKLGLGRPRVGRTFRIAAAITHSA
jgi:hypothetical protein